MRTNTQPSARFLTVQPRIRIHEGGYVHHPKDPGGATKWGVTQRTYDGYRRKSVRRGRHVKQMSEKECSEIYFSMYWQPILADDLPLGVDYAVYDFAVNSGPRRAVKTLQRIVGAVADGIIGPETVDKTETYCAAPGRRELLVDLICDKRLGFMQRIRGGRLWKTFGRGWGRRVRDVRKHAIGDIRRGY